MRGQESTGVLQGADAFLGGSRPRTTIQVDGRALTYKEFIYGTAPIWDVAQVEVYRTPHTTTQGRNSIAGAILIEPVTPCTSSKRARLIVAEADTRQASLVLNAPLIDDQLAVRVAADFRTSKSWSKVPDLIERASPQPAVAVFTLDDYAAAGIMSAVHAEALRQGVETRANILVAGGAGSGKTTLVNALLAEVSKTADRIVLIEGTRGLQCAPPNLVAMRTKDGVASLSDLVRSSLRLNPDHLPIGEVRGAEALDRLKAGGTGHPGAASARSAPGPRLARCAAWSSSSRRPP